MITIEVWQFYAAKLLENGGNIYIKNITEQLLLELNIEVEDILFKANGTEVTSMENEDLY